MKLISAKEAKEMVESTLNNDLEPIMAQIEVAAKSGKKVSEIRANYPSYFMSKQKIELTPDIDTDAILQKVKECFSSEQITDIDGVKIDFRDKWVHLRKSNTEPIIRIYSEAKSQEEAEKAGKQIIDIIQELK